jgi:hypothetical protein
VPLYSAKIVKSTVNGGHHSTLRDIRWVLPAYQSDCSYRIWVLAECRKIERSQQPSTGPCLSNALRVRLKLSGSKLSVPCFTLTVLKLGIPSYWPVNKGLTNRHTNKQTKVASFNHFTLKDSRTNFLSCSGRSSSSPAILSDWQLDRARPAVIDREHTDAQWRPTAVRSLLWYG